MGRLTLLDTLGLYRELWLDSPGFYAGPDARTGSSGFDAADETAILTRFRDFVAATPDCFDRESPTGHVTGSALVVSSDLTQVLLTLHAKLGLWLQLGGHADGNPRVHEVAYREVIEESGLSGIRFLPYEVSLPEAAKLRYSLQSPLPFDFDCHRIPARRDEPEHVHYDVRYIVLADPAEPLAITSESKDLRWFDLDAARRVTDERSMHRQFDKLDWLRSRVLH